VSDLEKLGLNRESVQKIVVDDQGMQKVYDLWMQKVTMHLHTIRSQC